MPFGWGRGREGRGGEERVTVPEDGGAEEAEEVAAPGESEARDEVGFGDRGAAQDGPALEHGDGAAGAGEVRGGDEAVVAAADDHRVPPLAPGQLGC